MHTTNSVTICAPATSANCGPGFDSLAIALSLYNFIKVTLVEGSPGTIHLSDLPPQWREQTLFMLNIVASTFAAETQIPLPALHVEIWGEIPPARGLGSSATLRGGFLAALNHLFKTPLSVDKMISLVASLEHSADNASALFKGGFTIAHTDSITGAYLHSQTFPINRKVSFAVVSPDITIHTSKARELLPSSISFHDAKTTLNSCAYLISCFAKEDYASLNNTIQDFLHQPYRKTLTPFVDEAIAVGIANGAYYGWISGSGSSIVCICPADKTFNVSKAMAAIYSHHNIQNKIFQLHADLEGLRICPQ